MHITRQRFTRVCAIAIAAFGLPLQAFATQFSLPASGHSIVGDLTYESASSNESLITIGQRNNVGLNAMVSANPGIGETSRLPNGAPIVVPTKFLLPQLPRKGIIVNLSEMRLYYFPEGSDKVMTYPIGIGKLGKTIPIAAASITRKVVNPTWTPPESIREFNREQGIELPTKMGPGPDNPLGPYAIYLSLPTYLIHSTIFPESIGRRASFGCIRMNETDIKQFFPIVERGIHVTIVDMPNKVGWEGSKLYLETHQPLEEHEEEPYVRLGGIVASIQKILPQGHVTMVDWQLVSYLSTSRDGMPHEVGFRVR